MSLYRLASAFKVLLADQGLYTSPYGKIAKKFHQAVNHFKQSQSADDDGLVESVGPLKEINPSQYQFQATVYRDLEKEVSGDKFAGFSKLVSALSAHLGSPKKKSAHSAVWETVQSYGEDHIRISMVAYDSGSMETHSVKITVGPLSSDLL